MIKKITNVLGEILIFLQILSAVILPASNGTIKGIIRDAETRESLPFANVIIIGTSWGTSSDAEGNYIIPNIPPGKYTLRGYLCRL